MKEYKHPYIWCDSRSAAKILGIAPRTFNRRYVESDPPGIPIHIFNRKDHGHGGMHKNFFLTKDVLEIKNSRDYKKSNKVLIKRYKRR